jgi:diguanylate cyclase (GGDEF)-like protein
MGDQILRDVAEILNTHVRSYDLAARYAGDEFVIVLSRAGRLPAEVVAEKLKRAVERHAHKLMAKDPSFPNLGISIGIALYPDDATDLQGLLCRSDAAMYADKRDRHAERNAA